MRIVFFGSPAVALPSLERLLLSGHDIPLVVTQPDHPAGRGRRLTPCPVKAFARERGIPSYEPERIRKDPAAVARLRETGAVLHVVVAYGQIMPGPVIDLPPYRSLNVHFSLLPKYRGASPVAWAIRNGEPVTGITIFRLNERMDEGDIFSSVEAPIRPDDTTGLLEARLAVLGAELLVETIGRIDVLVPKAQNHALATAAPKLKKEFGQVDWSQSAAAIDRHVRAMNPWPTAFTFFGGERLILHEGRPLAPEAPAVGRAPGTVLETSAAGIRISCGEGTEYLLTRLQAEGRNPLEAAVFIRGGRLASGTVLHAQQNDSIENHP
jgi:methionyl-tRNA formyltransferase